MKRRIALALIVFGIIGFLWFLGKDYLSLHALKNNSVWLQEWVAHHYVQAVFAFIGLYIAITLLFLPIVSMVTIAGGFLFGTVEGAIYTNIGATIGSIGAFLLVRYFFGALVQEHYQHRLKLFNRAMQEGQISFLLAVHFVAVIPFPLVNLLAGLTRVPFWTFVWTTSAGIIPGSLVYSFAGSQLTKIQSIKDIFSLNLVLAFVLLATLSILPVFIKRWVRRYKKVSQ